MSLRLQQINKFNLLLDKIKDKETQEILRELIRQLSNEFEWLYKNLLAKHIELEGEDTDNYRAIVDSCNEEFDSLNETLIDMEDKKVAKSGDTMTGALNVQVSDPTGSDHVFSILRIIENDDTGISIRTPNNKSGYILFADNNATNPAFIGYNHNVNKMYLNVSGDRVIIDSSGRITMPNQSSARAYLGSNQLNITDLTTTPVQLNTETYDVGGDFNTITHLFTAPVAGYYLITASVWFTSVIANKTYNIIIQKNTTDHTYSQYHSSGTSDLICPVMDIINLAAGDTLELNVYLNVGASTVDIVGNSAGTYMSVRLLG